MSDDQQPASEELDTATGAHAADDPPSRRCLLGRAREEVGAGLAVLNDPMSRSSSSLVHLVRAWQLFAHACGQRPASPEELAAWVRENAASRLRTGQRERLAETASVLATSISADDPAAASALPTPRRLRAHALALRDALTAAALELDGWSLRRQKIVRWARRSIIALFVLVPLVAYAVLVWRQSGPGKWRGAYFPYDNFNGVPVVRRDDDVAFNWHLRRPMANIPADNFSVRWDSCLQLETPARVAFQLVSNNDSRLYIDGDLAVDNWNNTGHGTRGAWHDLSAGTHHLRVEYRERRKHALVYLLATFDDDPPRRIPSSMLRYPGDDPYEAEPCAR